MMAANSTASILLVDDHVIVRKGCRDLLAGAGYFNILEAAEGEAAYSMFVKHAPEIVVMDLSMPKCSGLDTIRRIVARDQAARIVVFSMHNEPLYAARALQAGAVAYVTKTSPPESLVTAVKAALGGERYLSHDVAQALAIADLTTQENPLAVLTPREFEIFRMLVLGNSNAEIGAAIAIAAKSVSNAVGRIKEKLGAASTTDLVRLAIKHSVIER